MGMAAIDIRIRYRRKAEEHEGVRRTAKILPTTECTCQSKRHFSIHRIGVNFDVGVSLAHTDADRRGLDFL